MHETTEPDGFDAGQTAAQYIWDGIVSVFAWTAAQPWAIAVALLALLVLLLGGKRKR